MYFAGIKLDFPQVSVIFSISGKRTWNKKNTVSGRQNFLFTSRNEELAEEYVPVEEKTAFKAAVDCCLRKRKKMVSTGQKISFHWLKHALSFKIGFHWFQLRFPLGGNTSEQKKTVFTSQKIRFN